MNTVPHITIEQANVAFSGAVVPLTLLEIYNKRIDAHNAQPEPVDPHATLRAEYAKQVAEGTTGFYLWECDWIGRPTGFSRLQHAPEFNNYLQYRCTDISCYVSKDGEPAIRMLRTEAKQLQRQTKDTHDWFDPRGSDWKYWAFGGEGAYTYRVKPAKVVKWADVPVGVAVRDKTTGVVWLYQGSEHENAVVVNHPSNPFGSRWIDLGELELAPANQQPLIPVAAPDKGLTVEYSLFLECMRITGLADGYKLEGSK